MQTSSMTLLPQIDIESSQNIYNMQNISLPFASESGNHLSNLSNSSNCPTSSRLKKKRIRAPVLQRPVCPFEGCNMSFSTSGHLARHFKIHSGAKTHSCPIEGCEKRFARKDNMMHHFSTHKRKLESKGLPIVISSAHLNQDMNRSPAATLFSEVDNPISDREKDTISSITSGRTAASVSPPNSFNQATKSTLVSETIMYPRRTKSAPCDINTSLAFLNNYSARPPLCNINTSSTFLNNYSAQPSLSASVYGNHSLLAPCNSINGDRDFTGFDLSQTFFDSPAFSPHYGAPLSAPPMSFSPFDTQIASHLNVQSNKISKSDLSFFNSPSLANENQNGNEESLSGSTPWNTMSSDQFDQHFASFYGDRKRSMSLEAWGSFSLD